MQPTAAALMAQAEQVSSFAEVDEILRSVDFTTGRFEQHSAPFRARTLLEVDGEEHRERRRLETPLLAKPMLERYERDVLEPTIRRCLAECDGARGPDGYVRADLTRLSHRMFLQIAAAVIGLDAVDTPARTDLLERCMYRLNAAFDVKFSTRDPAEVVAEGLEAKELFVEHFFAPSWERRAQLLERHRAGELAEAELPTDLLTLLLRHHGADWDADLPVRESILYMAGATETTSNAVNHAVVELETWLRSHPEDRAQARETGFLRGVCNEALRLRLNVTVLFRRARRDVELSTGRCFREGTHVALDFVQANRDPAAFGAHADAFDPWREVSGRVRPYGLAFGIGRHLCIGLPLVTTVTGRTAEEGDSDRAMLKILRALLDAGIELDHERPPRLRQTAEDVYDSLPVLFTAR